MVISDNHPGQVLKVADLHQQDHDSYLPEACSGILTTWNASCKSVTWACVSRANSLKHLTSHE